MIKKDQMDQIMDALALKCWGIISIDRHEAQRLKERAYFSCDNSLLDAVVDNTLTVIAIALPYDMIGMPKPFEGMMGKIDAFAWTFDYHQVVRELLVQIKTKLDEIAPLGDAQVLCCVDNSPFNDREVAFYAGLGQVGYNHLLINDTLGTHHFIGYMVIYKALQFEPNVLTRVDQLPKTLEHPFCKSCGKCVNACPTGVCGNDKPLENPMKNCLSALTQTKDSIDKTLWPKFGDRLYGCNTCQLVCPLNRDAYVKPYVEIKEPNWIDAFEVLALTQKGFREKYGHMGFAWRSLWVYKRNALIVIGNRASQDALDKLMRFNALLQDEKLGAYYMWAMEQCKGAAHK